MSGRAKLLDLFCGAGGASVGYERAGFDVTGCDIEPHRDYPFPMIVGDAMTVLACPDVLDAFDVVAASPPCPFWSTITPDPSKHDDLLTPVLEKLRAGGRLYIVENVEGARRAMNHPVKVCGSSFGLKVRRHRYFETNADVMQMPCTHERQGRPIGVYGDHPQDDEHYRRPDGTRRGNKAKTHEEAQTILGVQWMTDWDDITDAIPPAFTQFLGEQLLDQIARRVLSVGVQ